MSDENGRSLFCGDWTQPFDGGGRTNNKICQTYFEFKVLQLISNPFEKAFHIRKSIQTNEWDLWQKSEGFSEIDSSLLVTNAGSKQSLLLHVATIGGAIQSRTSYDGIVWTKWAGVSGAKTFSPMSLVEFEKKIYIIYAGTNKRLYFVFTEDTVNWSKSEEIPVGYPKEFDVKNVNITSVIFQKTMVVTVVAGDTISVTYTNDFKSWSPWLKGNMQETNKPVETVEFKGELFQARLAFDDYIFMRSTKDLAKWSAWTSTNFKTSSAVSMIVFNDKLIQTAHSVSNEVFLRFTDDGKYWTKWTMCGDEKRKTNRPLTQIVAKDVLYQTLITLDDFVLTRPITTKQTSNTLFKVDSTIASKTVRDSAYFTELLKDVNAAHIKSVGGEAHYLTTPLKNNATLIFLDLSRANIGNDAANVILKELNNHPNLKTLLLNGNQMMGAVESLEFFLQTNVVLTHLDVSENRLGDEGAKIILSSLKKNNALTHLNLSDNFIEKKGAAMAAELLKENTPLKELLLSKNPMYSEGCVLLADALEKNTVLATLELHSNNIALNGAKAMAKMIGINSSLTALTFSGQNLKRTEGTRPLADAIKLNSTMVYLNLANSQIGSEGAVLLIDALSSNKTLTSLNLTNNDVEDEGLLTLNKSLKSNRSLKSLVLAKNDFRRIGTTAIANALLNCPIEELNISNCTITLDGIKALSAVLKSNNSLKVLILNNCRIGNSEIEEITAALKSNVSLQELDLDYNRIQDDGFHYLATLIQSNPRIRYISLWGNAVGGLKAREIANALKSNTYLKVFKMQLAPHVSKNKEDNEISEIGELAECLKSKQNLDELWIRGNVGVDGATHIVSLLENNPYLRSIALIDAGIGDDGAVLFAQYLSKNRPLTSLMLEKNNISMKGATAIADSLKLNPDLTFIDLTDNKISYDAVNSFNAALKTNNKLLHLKLDQEYSDQLDFAFNK